MYNASRKSDSTYSDVYNSKLNPCSCLAVTLSITSGCASSNKISSTLKIIIIFIFYFSLVFSKYLRRTLELIAQQSGFP